jgi:hypothetical protein
MDNGVGFASRRHRRSRLFLTMLIEMRALAADEIVTEGLASLR